MIYFIKSLFLHAIFNASYKSSTLSHYNQHFLFRISLPFHYYIMDVRFVNSMISGIYPKANPVTVSAHP